METLCDIRFYLRQVFYENKKVRECWPQLLHNLDKTSVFKSFCPKLHPKLYPSLLYSLRLKIMSSQGWAIPNSLVVWDLVKMCFLPVNLSQTKDSGSNKLCPGRVQTPRTPGKPIRTVVLEKKLMGFNQSAPNYAGLSSKVSVSQKIWPEWAQVPQTPIHPLMTVVLKKSDGFQSICTELIWPF